MPLFLRLRLRPSIRSCSMAIDYPYNSILQPVWPFRKHFFGAFRPRSTASIRGGLSYDCGRTSFSCRNHLKNGSMYLDKMI